MYWKFYSTCIYNITYHTHMLQYTYNIYLYHYCVYKNSVYKRNQAIMMIMTSCLKPNIFNYLKYMYDDTKKYTEQNCHYCISTILTYSEGTSATHAASKLLQSEILRQSVSWTDLVLVFNLDCENVQEMANQFESIKWTLKHNNTVENQN
jgi:hypothetical protein